jgi:hypothetical protein
MRSKAILSFGYFSYLKYYFKISFYHVIKFFFGCCCKINKHSSMIARKYERNKNADSKILEEIDLINIVKTLRRSRFLNNYFMDA